MARLARTLPMLASLALGFPVVALAQSGGAASKPAPNSSSAAPALARSLKNNVWKLLSANEARASRSTA